MLFLVISCSTIGDEVGNRNSSSFDEQNLELNNVDSELISPNQNYSRILEDEDFLSYLRQIIKEQDNVIDRKKVKDYISDNNIDKKELVDVYKALGFKTNNLFVNSLRFKLEKLYRLEQKYSISKISQSDMLLLIKQGFVIVNKDLNNTSNETFAIKNCGRSLRNCLAIAYSTQVVSHIGCATLDVTVFGGLACHASVVIIGAAMEDNCDIEYENCNG